MSFEFQLIIFMDIFINYALYFHVSCFFPDIPKMLGIKLSENIVKNTLEFFWTVGFLYYEL